MATASTRWYGKMQYIDLDRAGSAWRIPVHLVVVFSVTGSLISDRYREPARSDTLRLFGLRPGRGATAVPNEPSIASAATG